MTDDVQLHCGDCLPFLRTLEAGSVDAVVTDPPYGIGFKYNQHDDTPEGYGEWLWSVLLECERCCRPGSPVFVWQAMLNCRRWAEWFPREWRVFAAAKNFVQMRPQPMNHSWDPVIVWWTPGKPYRALEGGINRDFHVADTASVIADSSRPERGHPCPRPLDQVKYVIDRFVRPGGSVLDPFAGSGTTLVAAIQTGRPAIGAEIDPAYFAIAEKRIREAQGVGTLFPPADAPALFADPSESHHA